jgi:hypothetical protein
LLTFDFLAIKVTSSTSLGVYLSEGGYSGLLIDSELIAFKDIYVMLHITAVSFLVALSLIMPYFTCFYDQFNVYMKSSCFYIYYAAKRKKEVHGLLVLTKMVVGCANSA